MNKKTSNAMKAAQRPTPEQLEEQKARALRQKLMSIAEGAYLALAQNPAFADKTPAECIARTMELAEAWMAEFYGLVRRDAAKGEEAEG